jgi:GxxExxY protein
MVTKNYQNLLHKELSYQIQGAAIEVRKNFGCGLKETIYQNAFAEELEARNIKFDKEKSIQIFSPKTGKLIGSYRPDFIIEDKILIELKAVEKIPKMFLDQIFSYLRNSKYELGYFINFASPKLYVKRVIFTNDRKQFLNNFLAVISLVFVLFSVSPSVLAAEIFFDAITKEVAVNQEFRVDALLNTEGEDINAIEGKIIFPANILELKEIKDGNSVVNLWIERPRVETLNNTNINTNKHEGIGGDSCLYSCKFVSFSGITPGGFKSENGLVFSLVFEPKEKNKGQIEFSGIRALKNDGLGAPADVLTRPLEFEITEADLAPEEFIEIKVRDYEPPESFAPEIARDESVFGGRWFLVFATQDKGSGIGHYEVKEQKRARIWRWELGVWKKWGAAESPYLLEDQDLRSYVYVKAIDKAGNERMAVVEPRYPMKWYEIWRIYVIITASMAFVYLIYAIWRKLNTKKHE